MHPYLAGAGKEGLNLHSQTIQAITEEYVTRRKQFKKVKLNWRTSRGQRKSLGWIPFKSSAISYSNGQIIFNGKKLSLWDSYGLKDYELGSGNISQDARGRWYINITVKIKKWVCTNVIEKKLIGIDLGISTFLATSDGQKEEPKKFYIKLEDQLAKAQRANKKQRVRAIHAKIANRRKDYLHKLSTSLVKECDAIFVGNVSSSGMTQTNKAKSVLDAGWSTLRTMLQYKCDNAGVWFQEVNEAYTTQTCSNCHAKTGPKGEAELHIKKWICSKCKTEHDRDINASINIKGIGVKWLTDLLSKSNEQLIYKGVDGTSGGGHAPLLGIPCL
jgi:IS605 OrfB family transposase